MISFSHGARWAPKIAFGPEDCTADCVKRVEFTEKYARPPR